jgi:hypothetical protein
MFYLTFTLKGTGLILSFQQKFYTWTNTLAYPHKVKIILHCHYLGEEPPHQNVAREKVQAPNFILFSVELIAQRKIKLQLTSNW